MKQLFTLIFVFSSILLNAQIKLEGKSPAFDEPEKGISRIIMFQNNVTVYLHFDKQGFFLKSYGPDFKQLISKKIQIKEGYTPGIFEMNNELVLFVAAYEDNSPTLFRYIIDPSTGETKSFEKVFELEKVSNLTVKVDKRFNVDRVYYVIVKDPKSDNYTISYNGANQDNQIEVVQFGASHKEFNRATISSPGSKFAFIDMKDMCVVGEKEAYALVYAYNTRKTGGKENDLFVAKISNKSNDVQYIDLNLEENAKLNGGLIKYNSITDKIHVVSQIEAESKGKMFSNKWTTTYQIDHHIITPSTNNIVTAPSYDPEELNQKKQEFFGKKSAFSGVLQDFYINDDGGFTFVYEGYEVVTNSSSSGNMTSTNYILGDIGVIEYNKAGNKTNSTLIPKDHMLNTSIIIGGGAVYSGPLAHSYRRSGEALGGGNQYKSFTFLNGKNKNYIFINDIEENDKKIEKGKITEIKGVGACDAFVFETKSGEVMPHRKFLFGEPDGRNHNLAMLGLCDYNRETNLMATLRLYVEGRDRKVRVVWLKLD